MSWGRGGMGVLVELGCNEVGGVVDKGSWALMIYIHYVKTPYATECTYQLMVWGCKVVDIEMGVSILFIHCTIVSVYCRRKSISFRIVYGQ